MSTATLNRTLLRPTLDVGPVRRRACTYRFWRRLLGRGHRAEASGAVSRWHRRRHRSLPRGIWFYVFMASDDCRAARRRSPRTNAYAGRDVRHLSSDFGAWADLRGLGSGFRGAGRVVRLGWGVSLRDWYATWRWVCLGHAIHRRWWQRSNVGNAIRVHCWLGGGREAHALLAGNAVIWSNLIVVPPRSRCELDSKPVSFRRRRSGFTRH